MEAIKSASQGIQSAFTTGLMAEELVNAGGVCQ